MAYTVGDRVGINTRLTRIYVPLGAIESEARCRGSITGFRCYELWVRAFLPIAAVILALITTGCIAYIAWEFTKEASGEGKSVDEE